MHKIEEQIGVGCADISEQEKKYVREVLDSERLSYGPFLKKFESMFSSMHQAKFAIAVNSGTDALRIAVACLKEAHEWNDGDEIICPAVTFVASSNVILQNNLTPVFVDVEKDIYNIDPAKIESAITTKTRAIMVVHLFGQSSTMEPIISIAKKHNLKIIEDSCETMLVPYKGTSVGSLGDIGCFSTYVAHLIVTGVGGLAVTSNPTYAEIMRSIANHGRDGIYISIDDDKNKSSEQFRQVIERRFSFIRIGYSSRITEMEGALGVGQLERSKEILQKRQHNAQYLIKHLAKFEGKIQLPHKRADRGHAYMMFPVVIKQDSGISKKDFVFFLEQNNIETRDMLPLINQPIYIKLFGELENKFPVAKWINTHGFYIGCHQKLTEKELSYIVSKFEEYFSTH